MDHLVVIVIGDTTTAAAAGAAVTQGRSEQCKEAWLMGTDVSGSVGRHNPPLGGQQE